jgi:hypothetical protein
MGFVAATFTLVATHLGTGWSKQLPAQNTGGRSVPCFPGRNGHPCDQTESLPLLSDTLQNGALHVEFDN